MNNLNQIKGEYGENVVAGYLQAKGYEIIARNYKCAGAEIDIIAQDGEYTVFIEAKYRKSRNHATGFEYVSHGQYKRIIKAAKVYLHENGLTNTPCRFDIIEVFGHEQLEIEHIENAFWE